MGEQTTYRVYPVGHPDQARLITTHSAATARGLAAFHFKTHRASIVVQRVNHY